MTQGSSTASSRPATGPAAEPGSGSRGAVPADNPQERQRFVDRVLDLMQRAESCLQHEADLSLLGEAVRQIDAVRALAAFVGLPQVVRQIDEFDLHLNRLREAGGSGATGTASDRRWLLRAVDRIRLLAVDPFRGRSTDSGTVLSVPVSNLERLTALAEELHTRLSRSDDQRLASLAAELHGAARGLYLLPLRPVCQRVAAAAQAAAVRNGRTVQVRFSGDDQVLDHHLIQVFEELLTATVVVALDAGAAHAAHLVIALVDGYVVVRIVHDGLQPDTSLIELRDRLLQVGGALDAEPGDSSGMRMTLRLPREPAEHLQRDRA